MYNYDSFYKELANKTVEWLPMDTEDLYQRNLAVDKNKQLLEEFDWIDKTIHYTFNSHGFRSAEFTTEPTIMFLGCSFTCGIGLPIESSWTSIVADTLKLRSANLGIGGSSLDTAFRLCHRWLDIIKPKILILMIPPGIRFELVSNNQIVNVNPYMIQYRNMYQQWSLDENNNYFNREKNLISIKSMCVQRHIPFLSVESSILSNEISLARDLMHPGIKSNQIAAEKILSEL